MPTIASSLIPVPKSWEEFEDITLSALKIRWGSPNLTKNGRQGQKQDGVDIYGDDDLGRNVGVQCKLTKLDSVNINLIKAEVAKADGFRPSLHVYYIALSVPSDANLQRQVRVLSKDRVDQGKFPIGLLFWDDIVQDLKRNKEVFKTHYPEFLVEGIPIPSSVPKGNRLFALLDLGYFGLHLEGWLSLLFGEFMDYKRAPRDFNRLVTNLEESSKIIYDGEIAIELLRLLDELRSYINTILENPGEVPDWRPAKELSARILSNFETLEYKLEGTDLIVFKIGYGIGIWEFHDINMEDYYNQEGQNILLEFISKISPKNQIPIHIQASVNAYNNEEADFTVRAYTPNKIYAGVKRLLMLS